MKPLREHLNYANVLATLAFLFAMSGGAIAATGGFSSGGQLQACVNEEGALKLLKAGKKCKKGQKTVSWNQTGPSGAKGATGSGATGAAGAAGSKGEQGAKGLDGESANVKWASVEGDGTLLASHGVAASLLTGSHHYAVAFDSDITNCAILATENGDAAGTETIGAVRHGSEVFVYIKEGGGFFETGFSITAYC